MSAVLLSATANASRWARQRELNGWDRCKSQFFRGLPAHMPCNNRHVLVVEDGDVETECLNALGYRIYSAIIDARVLVPWF